MLKALSARIRGVDNPPVCGRKIGLCIGINYVGTSYELQGCYNDAVAMKSLVQERFSIPDQDVVLLTDADPSFRAPTYQNIRTVILAAIDLAKEYAKRKLPFSFFFFYSGHGGYVPNARERNGRDSVLYPIDSLYAPRKILTDNYMNQLLRSFPATSKIICVNDCCYSGTMMDLPYVYEKQTFYRSPPNLQSSIINLSASTDLQLSFEAAGHGIMTNMLVDILNSSNGQLTWLQLCNRLNNSIVSFPQNAVLSVSRVSLYDRSAFSPQFFT